MEIFKVNNQWILVSIIDYWNSVDESGEDEESNEDYTEEINKNKNEYVDYNLYYEYKPPAQSLSQKN